MIKVYNDLMPPSAMRSLEAIYRPEGDGVNASAGAKYQRLFGRDTLEMGDALMEWKPEVARQGLLALAKRQGVEIDERSEQYPGKILHETMEGGILAAVWATKRGRKGNTEHISYVSGDATPMFVTLACRYIDNVDPNFFDEEFIDVDNNLHTVGESIYNAADWMLSSIDPQSNLVTIDRHNPLANPFGQVWQDSFTGYIRPDGSQVNTRGKIVFPEIQARCFDGLLNASKLAKQRGDAMRATEYANAADKISAATFERLWDQDSKWFASCLEEDSTSNELHPVATRLSSAGRMLNSGLFDMLNDEEKQKYIEPIVYRLFSNEFLTDAGIRTRSLEHEDTLNFSDYHGSHVAWPADTYLIAQGLRRQHLPRLADQLENRLLNAINMAGNHYEFFVVMSNGQIVVDYNQQKSGKDGKLDVQMTPEHNQGWTMSSMLAIKRAHGQIDALTPIENFGWRATLEETILDTVKTVSIFKTRQELATHYPEKQDVKLRQFQGLGKTVLYLLRENYRRKLTALNIKS